MPRTATRASTRRMPALTEAEFQAQVMQLATLFGWLVYHTYDSRRSPAGFPDLTLVRRNRLIFAELKTARGRVRPEQARWICELGRVDGDGVQVYVWRPADIEHIAEVLR